MNLERNLAIENYERFSQLEGSDFIASEFALETILKLIKRYRINNIFEIGLGIGCIVDTVQQYCKEHNVKINYFGTETNSFCLEALSNNLRYYDDLKVTDSIEGIPNGMKFPLIIIDGTEKSLELIKPLLSEHAIIFIEGYRGGQTQHIKKIFPNILHTETISLKKNRPYGPHIKGHWMGGGQLLFVNPNVKQRLHWISEKIKTKLKYLRRKVQF
jgi:hypothetical protein